MKKIITLLVVVALMATCMITSAFAAEETVVTVEAVTAAPGSEVTVTVRIDGNTGFDAAKCTLEYDTSVLTLTKIENGLMTGATNPAKGIVNHASAYPVMEDGVLFTAYFAVAEEAEAGEYEVNVTVDKLKNNDTGVELPRSVVNGSVTVDLCGGNHTWDDGVLTLEATCVNEGVITYTCTVCGETKTEVYYDNTNHVNIEHHDAVAPADCWTDGNYEYWYCPDCDCFFLDSECKYPVTRMDTVDPAHHEIVHVEYKAPTCFEEGNIEYWYCTVCGSAWTDELLREVTNLKNVILPISHNVVHVEAKAPTCTENGNIEYWYCTDCGYAWLDEYCHQNTNLLAVILPAIGHAYEEVERVEPDCVNDGYVKYVCANCGEEYVEVLPALGHIDEDGDEICDRCHADLSNPKSGDVVTVAVAAVVVSAMSIVALPVVKKHF